MSNTTKLFDLSGKRAFITGSSRGLGKVIAQGLGEHGAHIILNGLNQDRLSNTIEEMRYKKIKTDGYAFDITDKQSVEQYVARMEKEVGPIDILVNNAGIQIRKKLTEFPEEDWNKLLRTNLTGVFLISQQIAKYMIKRESGKVINICSVQSELARNTIAPYSTTKGGLKMLTRSMAVEWAQYNIQVNGIGPGYFITDVTRPLAENLEFDTWLKNRTPAKRWGNPEELIGAAVFFASDASSFVSGQLLYVDGGIICSI